MHALSAGDGDMNKMRVSTMFLSSTGGVVSSVSQRASFSLEPLLDCTVNQSGRLERQQQR